MKIVFIFLFLFFSSCSSVNFYSGGKAPISITEHVFDQDTPIVKEKLLEYFLWGTIPGTHNIDLSDLVHKNSYLLNSTVTIEVYRTSKDILYTLITLGVYSPAHFNVSIIGKKYEERTIL